MVLDISKLINNDGASIKIASAIEFDTLLFEGQEIRLNAPVTLDGDIKNIKGLLYLQLGCKASYKSFCSRCLEPVDEELDFNIKEVFSKTELENENDDVIILNSNEIDLKEIAEQALCCAMPITCLCSEDCRGLCPQCGCNLNTEDCDCETDDIDPRLAALKDFLK
ncbi:MAG: DUF177 domain-containing protein [Clostridia bacterium]|nr:DUF177 domain-containing protein [Clostridia bacterium]